MKFSRILYVLVFISLVFSSIVRAEGTTENYTNQSLKTWATAKNCGGDNQEVCAEGYFHFAANSMMYSFADSITGAGSLTLAKTPEEKKMAMQGSVLGQVNGLIGGMYSNPPASSTYYAYDVLQNAGFVKPAYAQGIGYSGLTPIQGLWKIFRNMSYMILVVVMVVIGFMIMFRTKMHAQTAITIQNALPNIVITLIVITFSYAIVGLLIDLMYFFMMAFIAIVYNFMCTGANATAEVAEGIPVCMFQGDLATVQAQYINGGLGTIFGKVFSTIPDSVVESGGGGLLGGAAGFGVGAATSVGAASLAVAPLLMAILIPAAIVGGTVGAASLQEGFISFASGAISPLLLLLMALALLFVVVRIFFILMNAYIQIIVSTIFAPIILLFGAIPGQNTFGNWFLGILANLMVFPTVAVLLIVANAISYPSAQPLWTPPLLQGGAGAIVGGFVQPLIGFGVAMLIPTLVNSVKELFHAKPVLPITPGMVISPIMGGAQTAAQSFMSFGYLRAGLGGLTNLVKPGRGVDAGTRTAHQTPK
jgi:hypothetical protein